MDGVQLPQSYRATTKRQFIFYHSVPRSSWYLFYRAKKDSVSQPWSHRVDLGATDVYKEHETVVLSTPNCGFSEKFHYRI